MKRRPDRTEEITVRELPPAPAPARRRDPTDEQVDLCERHQQEFLRLEEKHRDQQLALRLRQERERLRTERKQVVELGELWKRQGRTLGPGLQRQLDRGPR